MLNFLQENKGKSVILMLSDACGDFARGFKKVKAALADLADGLPVVSRDESVTESWGTCRECNSINLNFLNSPISGNCVAV